MRPERADCRPPGDDPRMNSNRCTIRGTRCLGAAETDFRRHADTTGIEAWIGGSVVYNCEDGVATCHTKPSEMVNRICHIAMPGAALHLLL